MNYDLIGVNIKMLREKAKMSQTELAENICTQAQISRIEKGEVIPLSSTLYEISKKLEIDMNEFFNMASYKRFDYISTVKNEIRKAIRNRDYETVYELVTCEKENPVFSSIEHQQFLLWHEGVAMYYLNKGFNRSIELLLLTLEMRNPTLYSATEIEIMNSIGIIFNEEKEFELSVQYYERALKEMHKLQKKIELTKIRIYYGLSKSLTALGRHRESLNYGKRGINLCVQLESLYLMGELHFQAGINCFYLKHYKRSMMHLNKSLLIFEIMDKHDYVMIIKENIDECFPV
ncbi:helix-turn-helix domain-containing protein [Salipaludibacillus aurantiacus]|uniref:Helix-turn-helix domain-containing protein n=1 Tax=Salipaludibacillus aurantiacus TaxID=1601833 RepID=A0A1H9WA70_9BACI|nr:helix-turn-helix domain-containing protein [Salipaludibacillus aurantiacus]SES30800.1 Helix-turn-helix domain-containing protein [Salipaludibacillus aurantiacus]